MKCIYCNSSLSVSNSRLKKKRGNVWRRRNCQGCKAVFTTTEQIDLGKSLIFRSGESDSQPFSEAKLLGSIKDTFRHRENAQTDAKSLTDTIITRVLAQIDSPEVTRSQIVTTTLTALNRFDKVAAAQYNALHALQTN